MMPQPTWYDLAQRHIGLREVKGTQNSPVIMRMATACGPDKKSGRRGWLGAVVPNDEQAWCGLFVAFCLAESGLFAPPSAIGLRARWWEKYGEPVPTDRLVPGTILTFWRGSPVSAQGHVGFYVGEDATHYHVLGGNQGDSVNITRIEKKRLTSARWPKEIERVGSKNILSATAAGTSNGNEA